MPITGVPYCLSFYGSHFYFSIHVTLHLPEVVVLRIEECPLDQSALLCKGEGSPIVIPGKAGSLVSFFEVSNPLDGFTVDFAHSHRLNPTYYLHCSHQRRKAVTTTSTYTSVINEL